MRIIIEKDYRSMSAKAADEVMEILKPIAEPLLCPATGDSPKGLYKEMVDRIIKSKTDVSGWHFIGLDEWVGMNGSDEGSCRFHLDNDLLKPLKIQKDNIIFFDGRAEDLLEETSKAIFFIKTYEGIDLAILGLGMNGHIGMNEPGTDPSLNAHVAEIDPVTQQVGIKDIMQAKHVILLISGRKKAEIARDVLDGEISNQLPASFLRNHPGCSVYLDEDAASLLEPSTIGEKPSASNAKRFNR
jgi:6-phosphogluconolactonase/glucosamine-6-phosphate isomerase/deaminase